MERGKENSGEGGREGGQGWCGMAGLGTCQEGCCKYERITDSTDYPWGWSQDPRFMGQLPAEHSKCGCTSLDRKQSIQSSSTPRR